VSYPSLEQYQEALQHPQTALLDRELKAGRVSRSNLGLPIVMCGGFALTYTVNVPGKKYAVRCFHKHSPDLEKRYRAISAKLTQIGSVYFLPFEFQPQGVRIAGGTHPVVKMAWAKGDTLGDFVADNYRNSAVLSSLRNSIIKLASSLEGCQLAHGDIQPGNVMVADGGASIQLIDYDGMFVPEIGALGAAEIGHRNFQHPKRNKQFDTTLDRFSLICITVALQALESEWKLWDETQSDSDSFLFRASDFDDPGSSVIFRKLMSKPAVASQVRALAAISLSEFDQTPALADFLAGRGIPEKQIIVKIKPVAPRKYVSQYAVLDARDYAAFCRSVGSLVELVGQVTDVKSGVSPRNGRPYIFINFGDWRGKIVKLTIWSTALPRLRDQATASLVGKWVSVVGLVEPPYASLKYNYSHISIDITGANQIRVITEGEAIFRLGAEPALTKDVQPDANEEATEKPRRARTSQARGVTTPPVTSPPRFPTTNAAILEQMQRMHGTARPPAVAPVQPIATSQRTRVGRNSGGVPWWVWIVGLLVLLFLFKKASAL
jgi:hypothetical protein